MGTRIRTGVQIFHGLFWVVILRTSLALGGDPDGLIYKNDDSVPVGNKPYKAISAGPYHQLALAIDGSIYAWGENNYKQSIAPSGNDYVAVSAGGWHSLALKSDGSIIGWGANEDQYHNYLGQATPPTGNDFIAISAGELHSVALRSDGTIVAWGLNHVGQASPPYGNGYIAIASGWNHGLALKADGSIVGWGYNNGGQASPPIGNVFIAIAASRDYSLALTSDGTIVAWGADIHGTLTPPTDSGYVAIAAGQVHSVALKYDGSVVGWGKTNTSPGLPPSPKGKRYVAIAVGTGCTYAIRVENPIIEITNPVGGEKIVGQAEYSIQWQTYGIIPTVNIEFSQDSGQTWLILASALPNTTANPWKVLSSHSYPWMTPSINSNQCLIRIADQSDIALSSQSGLFTVKQYSGGSGTPDDPYQIRTAEHLQSLALHPDDWEKYFILVADIDLGASSGENLQIGHYAEEGDPNRLPFTGSFKGNGKTLSNYRRTGNDTPDYVGLFGYLGPGGQIRNLNLDSIDIATPGSSYVGGLVGLSDNGMVSDCRVHGQIVGKDVVGGIVGLNWQATVSGCRVVGEVHGQQSIGGIVGYSYGGSTILDCIFQGVVTGDSTMGGVAGGCEAASMIRRCFATGMITGGIFGGGIAGSCYASTIEDCGSLCDVIGEGFLGGLVGVSDYDGFVTRSFSAGVVSSSGLPSGGLISAGNGNVSDSFWDIQTSTQSISVGGTGKSTAEMKSTATFLDTGWDFVGETTNGTTELWKIREGLAYPCFASMQESPYDFAGDYGVGFEEFAILAVNWQEGNCSGFGYWCNGADLDHSGSVDLTDLLILSSHWMEGE